MASDVVSQIKEWLRPIVEDMGLSLYDVEFVKEGDDYFLRVFVERPNGGIDLDTCAQVSEAISVVLDEKDPIDNVYYLEVSSPGAERPIRDKLEMKEAVGKYIHVKLHHAISGLNEVEGDLIEFEDDMLKIAYRVKTAKKTIQIPYAEIAKARLAVKF